MTALLLICAALYAAICWRAYDLFKLVEHRRGACPAFAALAAFWPLALVGLGGCTIFFAALAFWRYAAAVFRSILR